jgi:hypothetical protein
MYLGARTRLQAFRPGTELQKACSLRHKTRSFCESVRSRSVSRAQPHRGPHYFEMTVKSVTCESLTAEMSASGMPRTPNPPLIIVIPSRSNPVRASTGVPKTFCIVVSPQPISFIAEPRFFAQWYRRWSALCRPAFRYGLHHRP